MRREVSKLYVSGIESPKKDLQLKASFFQEYVPDIKFNFIT